MPNEIPDFDADKGGATAATVAGGNTSAASPYVPTDDLGPDAGGGQDGRTMLEMLTEDLAGEATAEELPPIALKRNPSYVVVYAKIIDGNVIDLARKRSKDPKKAEGIDGPKFAAMICVETCQRIIRNGQVLVDDQQRPLRFNHKMMLQATSAPTAAECARRFFGDDADMDAVARKIMTDSGWGADAQEVDVADPSNAG